jgi:hypothetical protein
MRYSQSKVGEPLYGIKVYQQTQTVRLSIRENIEYFSFSRYGGQEAATKAAQKRRDKILKSPRFKYLINGRPVRKAQSAIGITGVSFVAGTRFRNGNLYEYYDFSATFCGKYLCKKSVKTYGAHYAFQYCVKARYEKEGRPYDSVAADKIYFDWVDANRPMLESAQIEYRKLAKVAGAKK